MLLAIVPPIPQVNHPNLIFDIFSSISPTDSLTIEPSGHCCQAVTCLTVGSTPSSLVTHYTNCISLSVPDMIGNPLFDLENNLPDELFSTSGGGWGNASANVSQPTAQPQQQQPQQQQCVQRPQSMGPNNPGMGMSMGLGPGSQQQQQQNGSMDAQHHHQLPHMGMQNKASLNNMSGGAISGSAIGPNNLNMANSGLSKGPLNSKLNSPPGGAPMAMMNSMGNGPQMMQSMQQQQQQQTMNNMLNPAGMGGVNVPMKTPVSMMNAGQMGQGMHNGPQAMMGNARPGMPNNMMPQQQQQQQPPPLRGQLIQGMNPQGPRLQVRLSNDARSPWLTL